MKTLLRNSLAVLVAVCFLTANAHALFYTVPEIDPSMGAGALAVMGGVIAMVRGRRRK